jgi:hypothetical protein
VEHQELIRRRRRAARKENLELIKRRSRAARK